MTTTASYDAASASGATAAGATGAAGATSAAAASQTTASQAALSGAVRHAEAYLASLPTRPVAPTASFAEVRAALDVGLPDGPSDPVTVVDALVAAADGGLTATDSPRFFGYVIGGTLPAALAADVLAVVWDQNAGLASLAPSAAAAESVAGSWLLNLLGLPSTASVGVTTGTQMAHVTALAAARHRVLADAGWDVELDGLVGAPPVRVFMGGARHTTVDTALRLLGFGTRRVHVVPTDDLGRMRVDALAEALAAGSGPAIVVSQAGEVNTGAFDPFTDVVTVAREHGAWVHVDGAFGLFAAVSQDPARRALVTAAALADSWATDGHKWLNLPYDCGIAVVADVEAHRAAVSSRAVYIAHGDATELDPIDFTPEFSRRARGFAMYAALRSLGRRGLAEIVDGCCELASRFARGLAALPGATVVNAAPGGGVDLNQVLVRFDDDATTSAVMAEVLADGVAFMSGTTWDGRAAMRVSVCNWTTTSGDVDRTLDAVGDALERARASRVSRSESAS